MLQADRTTLCASSCLPSADSVTSTSVCVFRRVVNIEMKFGWWLFHRRLYCCVMVGSWKTLTGTFEILKSVRYEDMELPFLKRSKKIPKRTIYWRCAESRNRKFIYDAICIVLTVVYSFNSLLQKFPWRLAARKRNASVRQTE